MSGVLCSDQGIEAIARDWTSGAIATSYLLAASMQRRDLAQKVAMRI